MKNYLRDQSLEYLAPLPESVIQNLEYHFHTLDYTDFCRLLNALRQTIQRLAQVEYSKNTLYICSCLVNIILDIF